MKEEQVIEMGAFLGINVDLFNSLPEGKKDNAIELAIVVDENQRIYVHQYDSNVQSRERFVYEVQSMLREFQIRKNEIKSLNVNSKKIKKLLKEAEKQLEDERIAQEEEEASQVIGLGATNIVYDPESVKKDHKLAKKVAIGVGIVALAGALGYAGYHHFSKASDKTEEPKIENDVTEKTGYGFYKFDLSSMTDMSEYENEIVDSEQKQGALTRLNVLKNFNHQITLVDGETEQLAGLTVEQLIAVDAYANSNSYTREDYIKNFGLYDFSNVSNDFQQAVLVTGACLANPEFDGTVLADMFKDEAVKSNYLKQLEYRNKILNAETKKEQKALAKEYVEFLSDCSINQASEEYLDYDQHPGMAFATSVVVNALNYHNIALDKEVVSEYIIMGDEDTQSKLNSICGDAVAKIEAVTEFVDIMERALVFNETNIVYNENERIKAEAEGREPKLLSLQYEELDTYIRENLCDQTQINELTNKTLEKEEKLVTAEDQRAILANAVNIQVELLNSGKGGYYKDEKTAELAEKLQNKGDKVVVTQQDVHYDTPQEVEKIETAAPEQVEQAKQELNEQEGYIDNTNPEQAQQQIDEKVEEIVNEGKNYYDEVMNYYTNHGDEAGIPSGLQEAYNNLGEATFNLAKQTGVARYMTNEENKYSGGEVNITIDTSIDTSNVSTQSKSAEVTPSSVTTQSSTLVSGSTTVSTPAPEIKPTEPTTPTVPETSISSENNDVVQNNNTDTVSQTNGEIKINPELSDIDISDISTSPVSYDVPSGFAPIVSDDVMATYSLEDIYGFDDYSKFDIEYEEQVVKTK